jgi:hypothetical protein
MKIAELQSASKPLSPEQTRVRAMKQGIDRQKLALAQERERQQNAKHAKKMQTLHSKTLGCWRRLNLDSECRFFLDRGLAANIWMVGC